MKAYSLDLRKKIADAYLNEEGSIRQVAKRFKVSFRFVWGLVDRFRKTGSLEPKPHGGGNPPRINKEGLEILRQLVEQNSDATLDELCDLFERECQIRPSKSSLHRALGKINITRKKKLSTPQKKIEKMFSKSALNISNISLR